jgi:hypothetical protein
MPSSLRSRLSELAASFSAGVLDAIRGASLEELLSESPGGKTRAPARGPVHAGVRAAVHAAAAVVTGAAAPSRRRNGGRLPRRSAGDISQAVEKIVGLLGENPGGLRAEQIRQKLGLQAKELPRPLKEGLEGGRLSKVGRKRATTYFAGAAASKAARVARVAKVSASAPPGKRSKRGRARVQQAAKVAKVGKSASRGQRGKRGRPRVAKAAAKKRGRARARKG